MLLPRLLCYGHAKTKEKRLGDSEVQVQNNSEVACLLQQIRDEYVSAKRGLSDFAYGTAQHQFITQKTENMAKLHDQLQALVGDEAIPLIVEVLNSVPDVTYFISSISIVVCKSMRNGEKMYEPL